MKKTLALGMAAAMTATLLAGCGGSSSSAASSAAASTAESTASSTAAASTAESTGSYTDYSAGFPENVTIQIPVYDRGFENWNPTDNYYTRWIQSEFGDKYNVTVKYVAIARSNEVQDFNQMIAAGNAPTIIFHYDMPAAVNYWSEGAEQPIDLDEVAYYAPTYWDNMKDTIETYGKITVTGTDGGEVLVFIGRRRLVWRGTLAAGENKTITAYCDVFPIVPRGQVDAVPSTAVNVTVVGGALAAAAVAEAPDVRRIWVCGDSTVTDQTANLPYAPGTSYCGWGQMLPAYLPDVCITNHAHSGLTTESFTSEGHWDIVKPRLRAGDICLYQFGHNDQKLAHLQAYGGYTDRLRTYIKEARTAGAVPVLVTPLARNSWKDAAHYNDFLADFADAVLTLGKAENVMVLDLHTWAMALMQQDGLETAKRWFYPGDYTHTNDFGAYKMAGFVAHALGDALGLMVTDAPEWTPTPPFVPLEAPADCAIPAPEGDPFADYDATRPNDTLTRAEALELAIKALKLFPINVYNDLYSDIVGHETYAGTIQCAAQNDLIPPEWVADGSLYPNQTVTAADFLAVLIPGAAGRRPLADAVPVPDSVPVYARRAVGQAVAEGLIAPEALTKPLNRSSAAEICRRLHI